MRISHTEQELNRQRLVAIGLTIEKAKSMHNTAEPKHAKVLQDVEREYFSLLQLFVSGTLSLQSLLSKYDQIMHDLNRSIFTDTPKPKRPSDGRIVTLGSMKGKAWMADDFDEPLDDFREYM